MISHSQLEFLEEATNESYFQGSHIRLRSWFLYLSGCRHQTQVWSILGFFRFQPLYTGKKPVVTRFVSGLLFVCFIPQQQSCVYSSMLCQWWSLITNTSISSIWIKISINCNNFLNVCSYYRQWQLPNNLGINNSQRWVKLTNILFFLSKSI